MSKIQSPAPAEESIQAQELCFCVPPGPCALAVDSEGEDQERQVESVPVAPALSKLLQATLVELLPRATPFSLLLLHVTQFTFAPLPPGSPVVQQRLNCHAPPSFLERSRDPIRRPLSVGERTRPAHLQGVPFMQIPSRLPTRLKQLVPHALALELRCVPVGRDHNRLTVAMADPEDAWAISHLREATGMIIFPVCCEPSALETLLASKW